MSWNTRVRQTHRWLSLAFSLVAVANIVAVILQSNAQWLGFLAVLPLIPLMLTGLYLFALPYLAKRNGGRGVSRTVDG